MTVFRSISKKREIDYIVNDSGCKLLFTTSALREEVCREGDNYQSASQKQHGKNLEDGAERRKVSSEE